MATQVTLQQRLERLNEMISTGVRQGTIGGQTVTFNTTESLIKARDDLLNQINGLTPGAQRPSQTYAVYGGRDF